MKPFARHEIMLLKSYFIFGLTHGTAKYNITFTTMWHHFFDGTGFTYYYELYHARTISIIREGIKR